MNQIPSRDDWKFGNLYGKILQSKEELIQNHIINILNRATQMFEYGNLPDTIKKKDLEIQLLVNGFTVWKKVNGKWYTFYAGLGGEPNPYYLPTKAIIANPALKYNATLEIDENCVVMLNDNFYQGIMPTISKYAHLLTEAEITLRYAIINARIPMLLTADNDSAYASATKLVDKIVSGEDYGIVVQTPTKSAFEGISSFDFCKETYIKDIIEAVQYIKGSEYNEIGLNAAFNMKREAINEAEANLNEDILHPLCDTMLECRREGLKLVNEKRRADGEPEITVKFSSVWAQNRRNEQLQIEEKVAEIEQIEEETKSEETITDEIDRNSNDTAEN